MNNNFSKNRVPIIILLVDIIVVLFSVFLSVQIRGNFTWSAFHGGDIARSFIIILIVRCICFLIFKTNKILIRYDTFDGSEDELVSNTCSEFL